MSPKALWGFSGGCVGEESACNAENLGLIPELGRSPGGGHSNPLQYSWLDNSQRQRKSMGCDSCSPWGLKELDTTKHKALWVFFFFPLMFLTQYDTSVQKPLLIVLPKVFKKVSLLLLRIHQYKFRRWSLCFSLRDSVYEIQYTRFSISQGKLEFPISVPHYDEELRSLRS